MPLEIRPYAVTDIIECDYPIEYDWPNVPDDIAVKVLVDAGKTGKVHGFISFRFLHGGLILEIQKLGFRQDTPQIAGAVAKSLITYVLKRAFSSPAQAVTATVSETDDIRIKIYSGMGFESRIIKATSNDFIEFRKDIVRR